MKQVQEGQKGVQKRKSHHSLLYHNNINTDSRMKKKKKNEIHPECMNWKMGKVEGWE